MPIKNTPLITQYLSVKQKVADAILFFRLGDFYEMFFEDAEVGARILDIQLTSRSKDGVPLCGVPYHSAGPYIAKLLKAGFKVAICEQSTAELGAGGSNSSGDPFRLTSPGDRRGAARGLMPRHVVRVITPGTIDEETVLAPEEKNFLLALMPEGDGFALAAVDISTGEFVATSLTGPGSAREEISRLAAREIIVPRNAEQLKPILAEVRCPVTELDVAVFAEETARTLIECRFGASGLAGAVSAAAGAALHYVEQNFGHELAHLRAPRLYHAAQYLLVDETTRAHLELVCSSDGTRAGSLLSILDETLTPVGARTLANWLVYPLMDLDAIRMRHDAVDELFDSDLSGDFAEAMRRIGDLERLAGRIGGLRAGPRDVLKLGIALEGVAQVKSELSGRRCAMLTQLAALLCPLPEVVSQIYATIADEPPVNPRDGNAIRGGCDSELDELRAVALDARGVIARLEASERERARIPSLKVRYNQVFGYYIEVTKTNLDRVPADYERKQTLVGAERFTTPALKELERKILSAETGLKELEFQLFTRLLRDLAGHAATLQANAIAIGELDAVMALARVARRRGYVRPEMDSGVALKIRDGRHPVLEAGMKTGEFVPNDFEADPTEHQLLLVTGPNMAGKSTYLRQLALIVIMAQMGSFVPATSARLGVSDRVLTRIGARDDLRRGESTFMVEMRETSRLLQSLTERSLLLLDEVGRGTSTFDGLAIAWAVAEHLHDATQAKVLFATHFHELTDLARERPRVKNLSMAVREWGGEVLFLRRVIAEPASRSYGIEVARLAGLPPTIIARARQILANLEQRELDETGMARLARSPDAAWDFAQMNLFSSVESRALAELRTFEVDRMTPVEALNALAAIVTRIRHGAD